MAERARGTSWPSWLTPSTSTIGFLGLAAATLLRPIPASTASVSRLDRTERRLGVVCAVADDSRWRLRLGPRCCQELDCSNRALDEDGLSHCLRTMDFGIKEKADKESAVLSRQRRCALLLLGRGLGFGRKVAVVWRQLDQPVGLLAGALDGVTGVLQRVGNTSLEVAARYHLA